MTDQDYLQLARSLNQATRRYTSPKLPVAASVGNDGKIARTESKSITSDAAREDAHTLRHQHDGIFVGKQTILHNHSSLTTRRPRGGHNSIHIVFNPEHTFPNTIVLQGIHN